jgi:hypothetical protein
VISLPTKKILKDLEKLDIDIDSSQMQVLKAVLLAAEGTHMPVQYGEIDAKLGEIAGEFTKAYIYRKLKELEKHGFIIVDTIHSPRTYLVSESSIAAALETKRKVQLSSTLSDRQDLTTKLNRLNSLKNEDLALMLYEQLTGKPQSGKSGIIEGVENVRSAIIREFADGAKVGDVVRVLGHASTLAEGLGPGGVTELRIMQAGFRGVKVMGLMTPLTNAKLDINLLASHIAPLAETFAEASQTGNIQLRFIPEPINTYRIVCLNEDKMLLYLTHAKESDMAAIVHRKDNPGLVDDAIRTFDELWEKSIDVLTNIQQMTQTKEES